MRTHVARAAAVTCAAATLASATVLPWAVYGGYDVPVSRFPGSEWYLITAGGGALAALWAAYGPPAGRAAASLAGCALAVVALVAAALVLRRYDDATALLGPIVPLVLPMPGIGGPVAMLGALAGGLASLLRVPRHARDRANA